MLKYEGIFKRNTQKVSTKSDTKIVCNSSIAFKNEFAITIRFMEIWKEG